MQGRIAVVQSASTLQRSVHCSIKQTSQIWGIRFYSEKVRWFRATDVPNSKPPQFNYKQTTQAKAFEAFNEQDSNRLEKEYEKKSDKCLIQKDGLYMVDFPTRTYRPTYWQGPGFEVRRGTWFFQSGGKLMPLDESTAEKLEKEYQKGAKKFKLEDGSTVSFTGKQDDDPRIVGTITKDGDWLSALKKFEISSSKKLYRGYAPQKPKAAKELLGSVQRAAQKAAKKSIDKANPQTRVDARLEEIQPSAKESGQVDRPVKHLVLCVHGIGQQMSLRFEFVNFVDDVNKLRDGMDQAFQANTDLQLLAGSKDNHGVQVLPILWRNKVSPAPKEGPLHKLKPGDLFLQDNILADIVLDYVMYTDALHQKSMLEATAQQLNQVYKQFCESNPTFAKNPKVSLIGHSLGSVMLDALLLERDVLDFEVEKTFFLGSPVGILHYVHGRRFEGEKLNTKSIYNIMRTSDPVASRLEPLVTTKAVDVPPQIIPSTDKLLVKLKDLGNEVSLLGDKISSSANVVWTALNAQLAAFSDGQESEKSNVPDPQKHVVVPKDIEASLARFNVHKRLDFTVPDAVDLAQVVALVGHMMYLENRDVAAFILGEVLGDKRDFEEQQARIDELEKERNSEN